MIWRTLTGHMILDQTCSIKDTVEKCPMALRIYENTWGCSPKGDSKHLAPLESFVLHSIRPSDDAWTLVVSNFVGDIACPSCG